MTGKTDSFNVTELVSNAISEALLVPLKEVIPSTRLISELDAESIDVVDIRFRIEQGIGFKIDQDAMTKSLGKNLTKGEFDNLFTVKFIIDHVQMLLDQRE